MTLDSFLMAQTLITQAQWRAVVDRLTKEGERLGKERILLPPVPR